MMTIPELLAKYEIKIEGTAPGRYDSICPRCSKDRRKSNAKCLGVTIENDSVRWGCNHCGWTGPEKGSNEGSGKGNGIRSSPAEITSYDYRDESGTLLFQKVRNPSGYKARFYCRQPDGKGGWINNTRGIASKPLYRLPEVIKAIKAGQTIVVCEGEKDVDNLRAADIVATCNFDGALDTITNPKGRPKWKPEYAEVLRGADLVVLNDNDPAGYAHADVICRMSHGIAKRVRRLDLKNDWPEIPPKGDVSDWLAAGGEHTAEKLKQLIESAPDYAPPEQQQQPPKAEPEPLKSADVDAEITRLAKLPTLQYERERKAAAEKLNVRASILDRLIEAERARLNPDHGDGKQGRPISFHQIEAWAEPVEGAAMLTDMAKAIRAYVVMPEHSRDTAALWVLQAHLVGRFSIAPRLTVRSATKRCGKTTLLDVLSRLVPRPLKSESATPSVIFRVIAAHHPTLLIDEADSFVRDDEELMRLLKSGHRKGGSALRGVGEDHETRTFDTYSALAIALIGQLPDTLHDRALVIDLKRRLRGETVERFRYDHTPHLDTLARMAVRWVSDHADEIADADPQVPATIHDRAADNWRPLLAIADAAGGEWPRRAREAAAAGEDDDDGSSLLELLLSDIKDAFAAKGETVRDRSGAETVELSSADLVAVLVAIEARPWIEFGQSGKPITPNRVARMLRPLDIRPRMIIGPKRLSGYELAQFEEVFSRYLPSGGESNLSSSLSTAKTQQMRAFSSISQPLFQSPEERLLNPESPTITSIGEVERFESPKTAEKGESSSSNGDATAGLSIRTLQELADEYADRAHATYLEVGSSDVDYRRPIDAWLLQRLGEMGVFREHIEGEFERVMDEVFAV